MVRTRSHLWTQSKIIIKYKCRECRISFGDKYGTQENAKPRDIEYRKSLICQNATIRVAKYEQSQVNFLKTKVL